VTARIDIRRAEARDLDAIDALIHGSRAYQGEYYAIIEGFHMTADYLAHNDVYVAERDGVLGFYSLVLDGHADLDLMFVSDTAQGLGIGRALFSHMKRTARQSGHCDVLIGSHPPSVGFYERMGAVRCGSAPPLPRVSWERPLLKLSTAET
jgi:GNAT superfamily N-acetyltransferase